MHAEIETDLVQGDQYKLLCKTSSLDASFPAGVDAIEPDADKKAVFDLRNRVSMPVDYEFAWPLTGAVFIKRQQLAKKISIDIGESFIGAGGGKVVNWAGLSGPEVEILILKGAITKHEQAKYNETAKTFYEEYIQSGRFLTNLPANIRIAPGQPVKLWFITKELEQQLVKLKVDYTLLDETEDSLEVDGTIDPDAMYEICADPGSLGLDASLVKSYSVAIEKDALPVSESKTFTIDHGHFENNTYLFYSNRVGGINSLWLHGNYKRFFPTSSETSNRNTQITDTQKAPSVEVDYKAGYRKWEISAGYRDIAEQLALQEFLESTKIWLVDGNDIIPVMLEDGDNQLFDTLEDVQSIDLVLREAH